MLSVNSIVGEFKKIVSIFVFQKCGQGLVMLCSWDEMLRPGAGLLRPASVRKLPYIWQIVWLFVQSMMGFAPIILFYFEYFWNSHQYIMNYVIKSWKEEKNIWIFLGRCFQIILTYSTLSINSSSRMKFLHVIPGPRFPAPHFTSRAETLEVHARPCSPGGP